MTDAEGNEISVSNPVLGSLHAKGYRLLDMIWLPIAVGVGYVSLTAYNHNAEARDEKAVIAKTLKESNENTAKVLRESNENTATAIKAMALEQRKATNVLREMSCLLDPAMKGRGDARDFCKRISRDDR